MTKKIEFVAYVQTGKTSELREYDDSTTESEIIDEFNEWLCSVANAWFGEVD